MRIFVGWSLVLALVFMGESASAQPGGAGPQNRGGEFTPGRPANRGVGPRGQFGQRGPQLDGERGRPGRRGAGMRNLEPLFAWFDNNNDSLLDRQEFAELSRFVQQQEMRRSLPPMDSGPAAYVPPRPDGEPQLEPGDERPDVGPAPGRRGGRGLRGDTGPQQDGRGGRRGRGRRGGPAVNGPNPASDASNTTTNPNTPSTTGSLSVSAESSDAE